MLFPIKVVDIELSQPITSLEGLGSYMGVQGLVRLYGVPLGYVKAPVTLGCCPASILKVLIREQCHTAITRHVIGNGLTAPQGLAGLTWDEFITFEPDLNPQEWPWVTVAVCTRDRPEDLQRCLDGLCQLDYPHLDLLVIDNAPQSDATQTLVTAHYPAIRYIREPRAGLDWARNRAILEARGEMIAYTDDDVVVDQHWVKGIAQAFLEHPDVMAVTGLVVPYELETEAQVLFEAYGGFGRGFDHKDYQLHPGQSFPWQWLGAGQFGTGANMAYRRSIFEEIGYFDPALDVGTPTHGTGDLDMFIRVLQAGYRLTYSPRAMIRHRHRRDYTQLRKQISFNGSLYALWFKIATHYPTQRLSCYKVGLWWMLYWNIRRLIIASFHRTQFPRDLMMAECLGALSGLTAYPKSNRQVTQIVQDQGWPTGAPFTISLPSAKPNRDAIASEGIAIRSIELSQPLQPLTDLHNYTNTRIYVNWHHSPLGSFDYCNQNQDISVLTLQHQIVQCDSILEKIEQTQYRDSEHRTRSSSRSSSIAEALLQVDQSSSTDRVTLLPIDIPVSIIVGTYDRTEDLRLCLESLEAQQTQRKIEIIVVDNHPSSGLSRPLKTDFPAVIWIDEPRQGVAYARNAGINVSTGEILITIDDDVIVPSDWIEKLIAPLARADVVAVAGNILPLELETQTQQIFETYGGLGRGFETQVLAGHWYDEFSHKPVPTWELGGTANAAFRAHIFCDSEIGLMDEALGPGMPSGVGEDSYLFYKIIKAGYAIAYEPTAFVWHRHRRTLDALQKQIYNYSKGHVAHNLTTWIQDADWRGLAQVLLGLPAAHLFRIKAYLLRRSSYPLSFIWLEIQGNLAGPWSLWRSHCRVRKEGRSDAYILPNERPHRIDTVAP